MERILKSKYKILDKISETVSRAVYQGVYVDENIPLLIRIYKRDYLNTFLIKQLKKEVASLTKLNYPKIPRLIDGDYGWQGFYFIREFINGTSLSKIKKPLDIEKAENIAKEISEILAHVHSLGIVHGCLDADNIFIENNSSVKIADFCINTLLTRTADKKASYILNNETEFIAPEQILGKRATASSDVYNLGLILFFILCGKKPFSGKSNLDTAMNHSKQNPPLPSSINPKVPKYLDEIILKCLQKDPLLRFADAQEILESINKKAVIFKRAVDFEMPEINYYGQIDDGIKEKEDNIEKIENITVSQKDEIEQQKSSINIFRWVSIAVWVSIISGIIYSLIHIFILGE